MISADGGTAQNASENKNANTHGKSLSTKTKWCEECRTKEALYLCPRCNFRSCSLACCKAHKVNRGCNGKRDRTAFVRSMTDDNLQSDYHFLEDILGTVDSSKRLLRHIGAVGTSAGSAQNRYHHSQQKRSWKETKGGEDGDMKDADSSGQSHSRHTLLQLQESHGPAGGAMAMPFFTSEGNTSNCSHPKWRHFQKQVAAKGIQVLFMPDGMERHKLNRSYIKSNKIYWTVEWLLYSSSTNNNNNSSSERQQQCKTSHIAAQALSEDEPLWTAVSQVHPEFTAKSSSRLLLKRLPCPSNQPSFVELCDAATLATALKDTTVLEFPTIHVVPLCRLQEFPRVITEVSVTTAVITTTSSSGTTGSTAQDDENPAVPI